jgi:nitrate reductase gamma subunit
LVLGLVVAVMISGQIVLLMGGRRPLDKRLRDLGTGGDAFALLWAAVLTLGATAAVIWAYRRPQPPARHQSSHDQ